MLYFLKDPVNDDLSLDTLARVSVLRDKLTDEDHQALDKETLDSVGRRYKPMMRQLLFSITCDDKRLKYIDPNKGEDYLLLQSHPALVSILEKAWEERKFKEVRKLEVLWPPLPLWAKRVHDKNCEILESGDATTMPLPTKLHVVVSLIRHAESHGNVTRRHIEEPDSLTERGVQQAHTLGKEWENVHIEHLFSSPFARAAETANAIKIHNVSHPEIEHTEKIVEHYWGRTALEYSKKGMTEEVHCALSGMTVNRNYRPSGGGESYHDVGVRAREFVENEILGRFGVALSDISTNLLNKQKSTTADVLPEGIPHIVLVSHNLFLTELYEGLLFWNMRTHEDTTNKWGQATWSRHILCYDMETGELEFSDMRAPRGQDKFEHEHEDEGGENSSEDGKTEEDEYESDEYGYSEGDDKEK